MQPEVVRLVGVTKAFNVGTPIENEVLHGIDLQLTRGEFAAVVGPSGSGKSTLLNLIGLLDRPTQGRLAVTGQETTELDDARLTALRGHAIGFVFQYHHLIAAFTALENVMMPMLLAGQGVAGAHKRAQELLESVGLGHRLQHKPGELSGGERQRAAVARALVNAPACVLGDEPTGNLDEKTAANVFAQMLELNRAQRTSLVLVTHDRSLARKLDRVLELHEGKLRELAARDV